MNFSQRYMQLEKLPLGQGGERIMGQLAFAVKMYENKIIQDAKVLEEAFVVLEQAANASGCITAAAGDEAEHCLLPLAKQAKEYKIICAAHAHIDMDWMWGTSETVAITLDTFRTMLDLMKEFPDFHFSQSQASVYQIVEEYDPAMLEEIKARVKEGRWEVTASTWVEADKNMPCGESHARHILYTKQYMKKLFGLESEDLNLDFEPDTFGHSENVPEILAHGKVDYYYHCRAFKGDYLYNWEAPSGKQVLVYREPLWYNGEIDYQLARYVPDICTPYPLKTIMKVYGVGDHGGGPTRRDLRMLLQMAKWPVYPRIELGTFAAFFKEISQYRDSFPVVKQELNCIFTGCYTSQSRIKMANRLGEKRLLEAERINAAATMLTGAPYVKSRYSKAWEKVLYNHFHDILPGSGVIETREGAMGQFQQVMAIANTGLTSSMRKIAAQIDTSFVEYVDDGLSRSEGAGVGYDVYNYAVPAVERGSGVNRVFHVFNSLPKARSGLVEITVWDWCGDKNRAEVSLPDNTVLAHQLIDAAAEFMGVKGRYWGHSYFKMIVQVSVPALGYQTLVLKEKEIDSIPVKYCPDPRIETLPAGMMENDYLRVTFDSGTGNLLSIWDKEKNQELLDAGRPSGFFYIQEETTKGMTAWNEGQPIRKEALCNFGSKIIERCIDPKTVRQFIQVETTFRESKIRYQMSLDQGKKALQFSAYCDWQERPSIKEYVPQLRVAFPLAYPCSTYKYDIPMGVIAREGREKDVPALSFACGIPETKTQQAVMLVSATKYGFSSYDNILSMNLLRSSYEPDPYPELGEHHFSFSLQFPQDTENATLVETSMDYNHSFTFMSVSAGRKGVLPAAFTFMEILSGTAVLSSLKISEDSDQGAIIRLYEANGEDTIAKIQFAKKITHAELTDINELPIAGDQPMWRDSTLSIPVKKKSIVSLKIWLE